MFQRALEVEQWNDFHNAANGQHAHGENQKQEHIAFDFILQSG